jgi:NTE family protein
VPAVDIAGGGLRLFDNADAPLGALHFAASSAIPLLFEPVELDGRLYWDGDMVRDSALPPFLDRLRERGRLGTGGRRGRTLLVTIEQMCRARPVLPESDLEIAFRAIELLLHGKMRHHGADLEGIDHVLHIERAPLPHDAVSGQFDYSPERIAELRAQGREQALAAWQAWDGAAHTRA